MISPSAEDSTGGLLAVYISVFGKNLFQIVPKGRHHYFILS
jgi:hypothetical protein